ncbi:hypothetical protein HMF7854_12790 [Sphingomonas ginkgonis]|uniref:DUF995 domain-containing protein n=1 Tax=Sphingomonas ginkgonis TaxID=2315330 RepID=A0A429VCJ4_9SPHN|nr:hypothetical protein [Sphingomonas ginkgonis]RST31611.1 hypothetical protein HMF7854_12790 [Sphingomonas ginkgonis]
MRLLLIVPAATLLFTAPAALAKSTEFQLNETSWTFVRDKLKMRETIDAKGNYIQNQMSGKHVDHGTAVMKDGKACFTSAMNSDGERCWTVKPVAIGHAMTAVSDKGEKLVVTRTKYMPLKMPK